MNGRLKGLLGGFLFWGGLVALAGWIWFEVFTPAVDRRRATRDWVSGLRREIDSLERERDRLAIKVRALEEGERTVYEQGVRNLGYVPEGRVRVIPADAPPPPLPGTAPPGEPPR